MKRTLVDAREPKPEIKEEPLSCSCEVLAPCEYCVKYDLE